LTQKYDSPRIDFTCSAWRPKYEEFNGQLPNCSSIGNSLEVVKCKRDNSQKKIDHLEERKNSLLNVCQILDYHSEKDN
jgi:hypothetical protein